MIQSNSQPSFIIKKGYHKNVNEYEGSTRFEYWKEVINKEFVNLDCDIFQEQSVEHFNAELRGGIGVEDIRFSEVISHPHKVKRTRQQIVKSKNDDFLISFQLDKACILKQDDKQAMLSPDSFALYDTTQPYSLDFSESFHQFIIQIPRKVLSRHLIEPEKYTAIPIDAASGLGVILRDYIFSLVGQLNSSEFPPNQFLSENLVNFIALCFSSSVTQHDLIESQCVKDALIRRINTFIENNLFNEKLNNTYIAESQGISVRYLNKLFQKQTESVHSTIMNKRLEASYKLLTSNERNKITVGSVAYHIGFSSASHFSRAFKSKYGISPSNVSN